jgi:hypothetical protein
MIPPVGGMAGSCHYSQPISVELSSSELFCLGWPGTMILLISALCTAGMTGTCHLSSYWCHKTFFAWADLKPGSSQSQPPK